MNLMMLLEMAATAMRDKVAAGPADGGLTCGRLMDQSAALAGRLRESGARHMVVCDESSGSLLTALFGAAWAGVPYVPLNYRLPDDQLRNLAARLAPALAVTDTAAAGRLAGVAGLEVTTRRDFEAGPGGGHTPAAPGDWPSDPEKVAVLLHTSGTSGAPKSALLRHRHLASYVFTTVEFAHAGIDEAHLMAVPPYHVASVAALLSQLYSGRRIVMLPRFDAEAWIDTARAEQVTHATLVPTMMDRITDALERRGETMPSLRSLAYGGGKCHRRTVERALRLFPAADFVHAYGLTETSSTVAVLGPEDHRRAMSGDDPAAVARLSSVGRPLPSVEITVRDADGHRTAAGEPGEIWVRGEHVAGEYRETGSTLDAGGWFPTRDSGYLDADGYLFLMGRNDDVIIRGGENMSPGEIEDALMTHPDVADAAAFGVPSVEWGEEVAAAVVARDAGCTLDAGELRELVRRLLRSSRVPSVVEFVDELPYNDTGKLLRRVLRDRYSATL